MKKAKLLISIITLAILLSSCANAQEESSPTLPSFRPPVPSATPYSVPAPSPTPESESGMREKIILALNHMIRTELDILTDSPLKNAPKQEAVVRVYGKESDPYYVFVTLKDRVLKIMFRDALPGRFVYAAVWLYEEEMPGDTFEYTVRHNKPARQVGILDEFTYIFDPDCEFTYENKYFYMWENVRDQVILRAKESAVFTGEFTILFCDYNEIYFVDPEVATVVVVLVKDSSEWYFSYTINTEGIEYVQPLHVPEKEMAYYRAHEFDRETVYLE